MKYLKQFGIILSFSFAGEILNYVLPLPVPASIYGIVLLFLCLRFRLIKLPDVAETGYFLIETMPIMFVPAAVGLFESWQVIRPSWAQYLIVSLLSTIIVMVVTGRITQAALTHHKHTSQTTEKAVNDHELC